MPAGWPRSRESAVDRPRAGVETAIREANTNTVERQIHGNPLATLLATLQIPVLWRAARARALPPFVRVRFGAEWGVRHRCMYFIESLARMN